MSLIVIKDNHITFMGTRYFVANAQTVSIGSYGKKATPVFGQNKLEVKAHVPVPKLAGKIKVAGPFDIDTTKSSESDFKKAVSGSLKVIGFSGSAGATYTKLTQKHLKLVQLYVEDEAMEQAVNNSPKVLDNLRSYGSDARLVSQLFLVLEGGFAESFTRAQNYDVSADVAGIISIKASGGSTVSGKDKITLAPGTCLAYLLLKPQWNKNKTQIQNMVVDEWGIN